MCRLLLCSDPNAGTKMSKMRSTAIQGRTCVNKGVLSISVSWDSGAANVRLCFRFSGHNYVLEDVANTVAGIDDRVSNLLVMQLAHYLSCPGVKQQ